MKIGDKIYEVLHYEGEEPKITRVLSIESVSNCSVFDTRGTRYNIKKDGTLEKLPKEKKAPFAWHTYHTKSEYIEKIAASMKEKKERKALIDQIVEKAQTLPIEILREIQKSL